MTEERAKRKLAAILSADVKGYSRLMGEDELSTVRTLESYRSTMADVIERYRGRVVDSPGDNLLAEFASVVDALESAVEIQKKLKSKNEDLPKNRRMEFRVGINLGDLIEEGERIYGDGVNVASRIEGLADAGGICISRTAFDQIKSKVNLGYEYLGVHAVKNISEPVRVYKVLIEPEYAGKVIGEVRPKGRRWRWAAALLAVILVVAVLAVWNFYFRPPSIKPASQDRMMFPLPEKPSIAVLPFVNVSGDTEQEYFSDGITDDLITDLSKVSGLFVIARNSTFTYKGKAVEIRQVAEELGVRYVLEGSVRKAGEKIRINAQLIDATTGHHLWADRYDGQLSDVFALQDKVNQKIVAALAVKLSLGEQAQIVRKETENIEAYDAFLKGWEHYRRLTSDDFAKAVSHFENAIEFDPSYWQAHAALALTYWTASEMTLHWSLKVGWAEARLRALQYMRMAEKNPSSIYHRVASDMCLSRRQWTEAIVEAERAMALDPNEPSGYLAMSIALIFDGRPENAPDFVQRAMRLDPHNPARHLYLLGLAHFGMKQLEKARDLIERALTLNPEAHSWALPLASIYGHFGHNQAARTALYKSAKELGGHLMGLRWRMYFWPFKDPKIAELFADGLLKAGMSGRPSGYYKVSEEDKLNGGEIEALVVGRKVAGCAHTPLHSRTGYPFEVVSEIGKKWIEGNMLCIRWQTPIQGFDYCAPVFRNREGTPEGLDEYLIMTHYAFVTFSPLD